MKQIIDVPEGHTVTITQEGNQLTVETKSIRATHKAPLSTAIDFGKVRTGDILIVDDVFKIIVGTSDGGRTLSSISYNPRMRGLGRFTNETTEGSIFHKLARKATEVEKRQLFDTLRDKYALMWDGKELVNWRCEPGERYDILTIHGDILSFLDMRDPSDATFYACKNYFPEGFLTDQRIAEFKEVTAKLFASWRK